MMRRLRGCAQALFALALACAMTFSPLRAQDADDDAARYGTLLHFKPAGTPRALVFLFSHPRGWNLDDRATAEALAARGVYVLGVNWPSYVQALDSHDGECLYLLSEVEAASQETQRTLGLDRYLSPILVGQGAMGALVSAALTQTPDATIAGVVAIDPTEAVPTRLPLCPGAPATRARGQPGFIYGVEKTLPAAWRLGFTAAAPRAGEAHMRALVDDGAPGTIEAARDGETPRDLLVRLVDETAAGAATNAVSNARGGARLDLPLIELPVMTAGDGQPPVFAIVISGDGGWRDLDKTIAEDLRAKGIPVVGWDALRYFWRKKSPEEVARDLGAVIDAYAQRWRRPRVVLIGYSFGAGVMPFAFTRLGSEARERVVMISLLGFETSADFEIQVTGWLGGTSPDALPTVPELAKLPPALVQCFMGREEEESACSQAKVMGMEMIETPGGHHFDGDYAALAERVRQGALRRLGP
jgi:type IV secretory pathway VirJ component